MHLIYTSLLVLGFIVAVLFSALVFFTGKGDAMSGSGSVRTTFKGKAGFDDYMSRLSLVLGLAFMVIMLALNVIASRYPNIFPTH
jgi:preprotein translocase subunit SecG